MELYALYANVRKILRKSSLFLGDSDYLKTSPSNTGLKTTLYLCSMSPLLTLLADVQRCPTHDRAVGVLRNGLATLPPNERAALAPVLLGLHRQQRLAAGSLVHTLSLALALPEWLIETSMTAADSPAHALLLLAQHSPANLDHLLPTLPLCVPATVALEALLRMADPVAVSVAPPAMARPSRYDALRWMPTPMATILARPARPGPIISVVARTEHVALWLDGTEVRRPPAPIANAINAITKHHGPVVLVASPARASSLTKLLVHDVVEIGGTDMRMRPYAERQNALRDIFVHQHANGSLVAEDVFTASSWAELDVQRHHLPMHCHGIIVHHSDAPYGNEHAATLWTRPPIPVRTVLMYVDRSRSADSPRGTWTLGLRAPSGLVPLGQVAAPVTTAYGIDARVASMVLERFGPVRTLQPGIVVDATIEALQPNKRKTCGYDAHGLRMGNVSTQGDAGAADTIADVVARFGA